MLDFCLRPLKPTFSFKQSLDWSLLVTQWQAAPVLREETTEVSVSLWTLPLPEVPGSQSRSGWRSFPNLCKGFSWDKGNSYFPNISSKDSKL